MAPPYPGHRIAKVFGKSIEKIFEIMIKQSKKDIESTEINKIIQLSEKYSDMPMDLADASLIVISERLKIKEIITIDSDHYIYRTVEREMIKNIFNCKN